MSNVTDLQHELDRVKLQNTLLRGQVADAAHIVTRFRAVLGGLRYKDDAEGQRFKLKNAAMATRCDTFLIAAIPIAQAFKEHQRQIRELIHGYKVGDVRPNACYHANVRHDGTRIVCADCGGAM